MSENEKSWTRERAREFQRQWRAKHPGKAAQYAREWRLKNPEKEREQRRRYREKNREVYRARQYAGKIRRKYGLTVEKYQELWTAQSGVCAVCALVPAQVVDHRHSDGQIRGLLCHKCNTALGLLNENLSSLAAAIEYLKK